MSYILDALQRAEAERERGQVPGLHARPLPQAAPPVAPSARQRALLAIGVALALGVLAAGLWFWHSPVSGVAAETAKPATMVSSPPVTTPLVAIEVSALPVAPVVASRPAPATTAAAPPALPETRSASTPAVAAPAAPVAVQASASIPLLSELPSDVRSQIPALTVNGAVYSENPAQRLLLVNGQVLTQGSVAVADVTLERIGAASSEFSFRGTRFRIIH
jgi:general secretion pathway protein B